MGFADRVREFAGDAIAVAEDLAPGWGLRRAASRARRRILNSGYSQHGASYKKKALAGWVTSTGGPDSDIVDNLDVLRERSRDLCMGEGLAIGALKTIRTNEIGAGLRLNSQIDAKYLGLTPEAAQAWEDGVEREFALWADSKACDAARRCTFGELQALARLSQLMSGDVFALLPVIPRTGDRYELKIKLVEADIVCDPDRLPAAADIMGGVEVGMHGEPIAYWFVDSHPGDIGAGGLRLVGRQTWRRVEAFGAITGAPVVLHLMESDRPGQRRGVPILAPVIEKMKQLSRYGEAELTAAVVSGFFTAAITSELPDAKLGQVVADEDRVTDDSDDSVRELAPGLVVGLAPGEKMEGINPARPNPVFDSFVMAVCKQIAAGLGLPYELLMMQFTSSYSASRAALLEAWKRFTVGRAWLAASFCQPVYEAFLEEAIARGYIKAAGFFSDPLKRAAWCGAKWIGPTQGQLDPTKEVEAAKLRVAEGFSTRTDETIALTGGDWWANNALRGREEAQRRAAGVADAAPMPAASSNAPTAGAAASPAGSSAGAQSAVFLSPDAVASIVTVDQALAARGLEPIGGEIGDRWVLEHQHRVDADAAPDIARRAAAERAKAAQTEGATP